LTRDELIDGWEAAWSGRDARAFAPLCDVALHYEDPLCPTPLSGPGALAEHARKLWHAFPDARLERSAARLSDGRYVAAPCRLSGTHRRPLEDIPPSGRALSVQVLFYCELRAPGGAGPGSGERLLRVRAFLDAYDAGRQLGILPARGGVGERALLMLRGFGLRVGGGR
jgi:predicted ester cyclase